MYLDGGKKKGLASSVENNDKSPVRGMLQRIFFFFVQEALPFEQASINTHKEQTYSQRNGKLAVC